MHLIITEHARDQMHTRGITKEQVIMTIKRGAKSKQSKGFLAVYTYMAVAYKIVGDKYIIKTVMVKD